MVVARFDDIVDVNVEVGRIVEVDTDDLKLDDKRTTLSTSLLAQSSKTINTAISPTLQTALAA